LNSQPPHYECGAGLRRVVKVKSVSYNDSSVYDHAVYQVESGVHGSEAICRELRTLDEKTEVGRRNKKIVEKIEKLLEQLR
jgi:uncharacterized membrane protein affecting hemolysin expression